MKVVRFRSLPVYGSGTVDREGAVLRGVSLAQAVPALGHGMALDQTTLEQIVSLGNSQGKGVKSRFTHPGLSSDGLGKFLGRVRNLRVEGDKAVGDLHLSKLAFRSPGGNLGEYVLGLAEEEPEAFGMSIVADGEAVWKLADGSELPLSESGSGRPEDAVGDFPLFRLNRLVAVDAVDEPAANRDGLFSEHLWASNHAAESAFEELDSMLERYGVSAQKAFEFSVRYFHSRGVDMNKQEQPEKAAAESVSATPGLSLSSGTLAESNLLYIENNHTAGDSSSEVRLRSGQRVPEPTFDDEFEDDIEDDEDLDVSFGPGEDFASIRQDLQQLKNELLEERVRARLGASGLSLASQRIVRKAMRGRPIEELDVLIEDMRSAESEMAERHVVTGVHATDPRVRGMMNSLDQLQLAVDGLVGGVRPERGVRQLQGLRELYMLLSGDYDLTGEFHGDRVSFANVNTTTMPALVANAMNKYVVRLFQSYDHFWTKLVVEQDHPNLQDIRWLHLGGIGEMPAVAEGAAYQETSWADATETGGWTKKGMYLGLTLEAIDKDDTSKLQMAPRALAQAAWMTLGKDFTRVFTGNPTMNSDSKTWFHADHANTGTSALSYSSLKATELAMYKQTELGSGERLGYLTRPAYYMVPIDLKYTALEILASALVPEEGTTTSYQMENVLSNGETKSARLAAASNMLVVNPFLTDVNNWYALADPRMYPVIGLGYRFGRAPEIFQNQDPNSGLMFTNDTIPIKVRWFYSLSVMDYRGVYRHVVA